MMNKYAQIQYYKTLMSKLSDRQLFKEIKSYRKHVQKNKIHISNLNPDDINNSDRLLVLREILYERGLEET